MTSLDDQSWEKNTVRVLTEASTFPHRFEDNVASSIPSAIRSVTPSATFTRTYFPDRPVQTARKSATVGKPTTAKRSGVQAKPDEGAHGSVDPIVVTESEDVPGPSRSKQPPRKSAVPQLKPVNGAVKGKGKVQGLQRDDPIDLEPIDDVSDVSDVETSIPVPRQRSSPNGSPSVPPKDEALQRKLLQVIPHIRAKTTRLGNLSVSRAKKPSNRCGNKLTSC